MKWMIASDIHGSAVYCGQMLEAYRREKADRLLLLGDLLYHGPRNDLPKGYAPKEVIRMLNEVKNGDILLNGHTHVPACEKIADENGNEYMYLNPGSVSIPKEGSSHSYMVYEKGTFTWKNMSGEVYREWKKDSRF